MKTDLVTQFLKLLLTSNFVRCIEITRDDANEMILTAT